jgi:hypothetical protein
VVVEEVEASSVVEVEAQTTLPEVAMAPVVAVVRHSPQWHLLQMLFTMPELEAAMAK